MSSCVQFLAPFGGGEAKWTTFLQILKDLQAQAGRDCSADVQLNCDLEGDAHGMRRFYVSRNNHHVKAEIAEAVQRYKRKHKVYTAYLRVLGVVERKIKRMCIKILPHKLVPKGSRPPPESFDEITQSRILNQIRGRATLFTDGNESWCKASRNKRNISQRNVSHRTRPFTKRVDPAWRGSSAIAGTQLIDSQWGRLKSFVPSKLATKRNGKVNEALLVYMWMWLWRSCYAGDDLLASLFGLAKASIR